MVRLSRVICGLMILAGLASGRGTAQAAPQYSYGCDYCHQMPPLDAATADKDPDNGAVPGNHQRHAAAGASTCAKCHGAQVGSYATDHRNGVIELNDGLNYSLKPVGGFLNQTSVPPVPLGYCATAYCHSDGKGHGNATPSWVSPPFQAPGDCSQCHGAAPGTGSHPVAGSKHAAYFGAGTGSCGKCHADHAAAAKPFAHATSAGQRGIEVVFAGGGSFTGTQCANLYCHSNGRGSFAPPTWGGSLDCSGCHGAAGSTGAAALSGKHPNHVNNQATLGANYGCVECHAFTVSDNGTIADRSVHDNGSIEVAGSRVGSVSAGTCSASYCHSDGKGTQKTVNWTQAQTLDCTGCHGSDAAAAFASAAGEPNYASAGAGLPRANSHNAHVTGAADCSKCHLATVDGTGKLTGSGHTDGSIGVSFNTAVAGAGAAWTAASRSCSSVACHSNGRGSFATPTWGGSLDCSGCHGTATSTGAAALSGKHANHVNNQAFLTTNYGCVDCHALTASDNSTIADRTRHANGTVDLAGSRVGTVNAGTCSASYCHSDGKGTQKTVTWSQAQALDCKGCHGSDAAPAFASTAGEPNYANAGSGLPRANSHQPHVVGAADCSKCHLATVDATGKLTGSGHTDGSIGVSFNAAVTGAGASWTAGSRSCSSVYCHSNGRGTFASPTWGATLDCSGCHGAATTTGAAALSGKHANHVNNQATLGANYGCVECHSLTVGGNGSIADRTRHANGGIDLAGSHLGSVSAGTCSASYCHSDGKGTQKTVTWSQSQTLDCRGCHGSDAAPAFASLAGEPNYASAGAGLPRANTHRVHVGAAVDCSKCHLATVNTAGNLTGSGHTNGSIDVTFNPAVTGGGATWTAATRTCSAVSCHSDGTSVATGVTSGGTAVWGATVGGCSTCHGYPPSYANNLPKKNSHANHVYGCNTCHAGTTADGSTIANRSLHGNGAYDLTAGSGVTFSYAFATSGGSCTNVSCHSGVDATWGTLPQGHLASLVPGDIDMGFTDAQSDHVPLPFTITEDCTLCHYANLVTQHGGNCQLCHGGTTPPARNLGAPWNGTCQQGACHPQSLHFKMLPQHNGVWTGSSSSCARCHDSSQDFPGPGDNCGRCHNPTLTVNAVGDHLAPTTTSNAQATYSLGAGGIATIHLTATDAGTSGVSYTRYKTSTATEWTEGTDPSFGAPPLPVGTTRTVTLQFYSADHAMNVETIKQVTFTLRRI